MGRPISLYTDAMAKHRRTHSNPRAGRETADQTSCVKLVCEARHEPEITLPKEDHDMTNSSLDTELLVLPAVGAIEVVISSSEPVAGGLEDRGQDVERVQSTTQDISRQGPAAKRPSWYQRLLIAAARNPPSLL
jgi:hypothetical protein